MIEETPISPTQSRKERDTPTEDRLAVLNRQLPYSDEAEKAVVGCILQDPQQLLDEARHHLPPDAFYHDPNRIVYEELCEMSDRRLPIDVLTAVGFLRDKNLLERVGGNSVISELYTNVPLESHFKYYVDVVKEKYIQRLTIHALAVGIQQMQSCLPGTVGAVLDSVQGAVLGINMEREDRGPEHIGVAAQEVLIRTETAVQAIRDGHEITGSQMGYSADVDRMWNGVERGDRIGICAHPSTGKTSLLLNASLHLARQGVPVLLFGLDDEAVSLARRTISDLADVDITEIRSGIGMLWEEGVRKFARMQEAQRLCATLPIWIDDRTGLSIQQIAATTRRWFKKHARKPANSVEISCFIGIDYWQNIACDIKGDESNDVKRLTQTSLGWKNLIKSLKTAAGMLLSQVNRDVKSKERPSPHNNKGSGALFEDCTKMAMLSNEARPLADLIDSESGDPDISTKDKTEASRFPLKLGERLVVHDIVKNKDGPTGPVWLRLLGSRTRFGSLVPGKKIYSASYNKEARILERQEQVDAFSAVLNEEPPSPPEPFFPEEFTAYHDADR